MMGRTGLSYFFHVHDEDDDGEWWDWLEGFICVLLLLCCVLVVKRVQGMNVYLRGVLKPTGAVTTTTTSDEKYREREMLEYEESSDYVRLILPLDLHLLNSVPLASFCLCVIRSGRGRRHYCTHFLSVLSKLFFFFSFLHLLLLIAPACLLLLLLLHS